MLTADPGGTNEGRKSAQPAAQRKKGAPRAKLYGERKNEGVACKEKGKVCIDRISIRAV